MGYLTCVDYDGTIYDTTKYCALQAQQVCSLLTQYYLTKFIPNLIFTGTYCMVTLVPFLGYNYFDYDYDI